MILSRLLGRPSDEGFDEIAVTVEDRDGEVERPWTARRDPVTARTSDRKSPRGYPNGGGKGGTTGR